jgi:hypothetical protein
MSLFETQSRTIIKRALGGPDGIIRRPFQQKTELDLEVVFAVESESGFHARRPTVIAVENGFIGLASPGDAESYPNPSLV